MINELLTERKNTHGDFAKGSLIEQNIKDVFRSSTNWTTLEAYKKMTLDMIAMKISRICEGDSDFLDHYEDIIGYTNRTIECIEKDKLNVSK